MLGRTSVGPPTCVGRRDCLLCSLLEVRLSALIVHSDTGVSNVLTNVAPHDFHFFAIRSTLWADRSFPFTPCQLLVDSEHCIIPG